MRLFGFPRSKPKQDHRPPAHPATLEGLSELLQGWLRRMQELLAARQTAAPWDIPAIDEKIDQLCQEAADDAAGPHNDALSVRLQRMKRLTLEEMYELRDRARQS